MLKFIMILFLALAFLSIPEMPDPRGSEMGDAKVKAKPKAKFISPILKTVKAIPAKKIEQPFKASTETKETKKE